MKKISVFCSFFAFLLASASVVTVPAHAGGTFCIYGKKSGGGINPSSLKLKQIESTASTTECTVAHYDSWAAAYIYLNNWVNSLNNQVDGSFIEITSDIVFAGKSTGGVTTSCNTGNDAFDGKILDLKDKIALVGASTTSNFTISGLCHVSSTDEEVGFVKGAKKIENIDFDDVYFKSTKSDSKVGIVARNTQTESHTYQNIHVKNSKFYGDNVGAILGYGQAYLNNISLTDVTIDGGMHAGGISGYLYAAGLNETGATNNDSYGKFNIDNLKISGASSFSSNESYFGGVAGYAVYEGKRDLSECVLQNLDIQGADYAGGLFGFVQYNATTADDSKYSKIYIGNTGSDVSKIGGNEYVGGLVGCLNEGYVEGTSVEVVQNAVNANIIGGKSASSRVGGLIGSIIYSSNKKMNLTISNNYVMGHVYNTLDDKKVGYLVGELPRDVINFVSVQYNYHYGEYNADLNSAIIGIGTFAVNGDWLNPAENSGSSVVISHNFRSDVNGKSAGTSLNPDGNLANDAKPIHSVTSQDKFYNGIISTSEMESSDFVDVLNSGSVDAKNWEYDSERKLPSVIGNNGVDSDKYNVTFDFSLLPKDSYIVFGSAWATNDMTLSKKMPAYDGPANTVVPESESRFPKAYIRGLDDDGNEKFFQLRWKYEKTATDYYDYLKTSLLTGKDVTVYAALDKSVNPITRRAIDVVVIDDKDVNAVSYKESDYHGSIVLSQKVGGVTYENKSELVNVAPGQSLHRLFIALAYNDTLIFNVSVDPKPGYEMTVVEANNPWADAPADENWGYNKDLGTFKYYANKMDGKLVTFKVMYKELSYNLKFTIPESMQEEGLFVLSDYAWFETLSDVSVGNLNAPEIYNANGCKVNWVVAGDNVVSHQSTGNIKDEVQYMVPNGSSNVVNELIPDLDHPSCGSDANNGSYTITLDVKKGLGEVVLVQELVDGDNKIVIEHPFTKKDGKLELKIPKMYENASNVPTAVPMVIKAVPAAGYVFENVTYETGALTAAPSTVTLEDGAKINIGGDITLNASFKPMSPVDLVFNENVGDAKSFFGDSWKNVLATGVFETDKAGNWTVKQSYSIDDKDGKFPLDIYRDGYCLQGYTLVKNDKTGGLFTKFDDEFIKISEAVKATDPITMYGYWEECETLGYTVYAADVDKGTLTLSRTFALGGSNETPVRTYEVGSKGLKIPSVKNDISFTGISFDVKKGAGVVLNADKPYTYKDHGAESGWKDISGSLKVTSDLDIKAPLLMDLFNSTYALDVNAEDVFYGDDFGKPLWTATAYGDKLPTNIYRTDAELVGWSFEQDATADKAITVFDKKFVETFESYENASQFGVNMDPSSNVYPVLFAVWETRVVPTYTVKFGETNKGVLTLEQNVNNKVISRKVSDKLLVPAVTGGLEFTVRFKAENNWQLDDGKSLVWKATEGTTEITEKIENGAKKRVDNDYVVTALGKTKEYHFVLDISSDETLYYGGDWTKDVENISVVDNGSMTLPTMAYSTDQCLAGWSVDNSENAKIYKEMNDDLINEIYAAYPDLNETTKITLYARWTKKVEDCAGSVSRIKVEADHGSIELVEKTGKDSTVHKLDKNGEVMLPSVIDNDKWTLRVVPDSSYKLESIDVKKKDKVVTVLHEGDKLPEDMDDVVLTAHFEKSNKTPIQIVNNVTQSSGNTLLLDFSSSKFEETRGVSARVEIIDMQTDKTIDSIAIGDTIASAYTDKIPVRFDRPGSYKVVLKLLDGDGKVADENVVYYTVPDPFEKLSPENWHMLSFAAVDASSIMFEEGVQFYWWDEGGVGEYWQYKSIHRGDSIDASRGYWYTSPHGAPLVWRDDYKDDGKDIEWTLDCKNSGWNLVANPHGWYVDLYSNYKDQKNAGEEVKFWRYDPETGNYDDEIDYLKPFEAVWVQVKKKTKWTVSADPVYVDENSTSRQNQSGFLAKSSSKDGWTLRMALSDENGKLDSKNLIGVSSSPFNDEEPPASMGDHVNLSIVDGKRALAKSFKTQEENMEWTISLAATSVRKGYLTIDGIADVKSLGYRVFVTVDGETTEMQEGSPLPVLLKSSSKTATVRVTKGAPVVAKNALIKGLRSARLGNKLHVSFDAPESLAGSNARVELLDVKGGVKSTVSAKAINGTNALELDAPQAGLYLLRVRAGSAQQVSRVLVK